MLQTSLHFVLSDSSQLCCFAKHISGNVCKSKHIFPLLCSQLLEKSIFSALLFWPIGLVIVLLNTVSAMTNWLASKLNYQKTPNRNARETLQIFSFMVFFSNVSNTAFGFYVLLLVVNNRADTNFVKVETFNT